MAEHTPGPWWFTENGDTYTFGAGGAGLGTIGTTARTGTMAQARESQANARLIAAAPDLLAALEKALPYMERFDGKVSGDLIEGRAAIAKARGS